MKLNFCTFIEKNKRVDMYLSALFSDYSRSYIQKLIDNGNVKVNSSVIKKNLKIKNKDKIELEIKTESSNLEPEDIKLDIIYEDKSLIIVNKNPFINTHPTPGEEGKKGTLVNALLYHCKGQLSGIGGIERPGIVHRLDKNTSGIIMVAKDENMHNYLQKIIKNREVDKYYYAIVNGIFKDKEFEIKSYIGRDQNDRIKMTTINPINPKKSITKGKIIKILHNKYSLLKIKLITGRTHQIRVHLASIGYPIIGDEVYGLKKVNDEVKRIYGLKRQALHAIELGFELYGKKQFFNADLKDDMKNIIF